MFRLVLILVPLAVVESQVVIANHRVQWKAPVNGADFLTALQQKTSPSDFYYLFTGDTQYWVECTTENVQCLTATSNCNMNTEQCRKQQGNHANRLQTISMKALIGQMGLRNIKPKGVIINGDLTNFGAEEELNTFQRYWQGPLEGVKVYPGLGNHDYSNNVNLCDHCAVRMLKYQTQLVQSTLMRPVDVQAIGNSKYRGSLAYSWEECVSGRCIHFVQLNNYPSYERKIISGLDEWTIESSFSWLERNLDSYKQYPFVINFHQFESTFSDQNKQRLISILSKSSFRPLAILFAHVHSRVGSHSNKPWCINGRPVPLLYTGSVPANNYMMIRFGSDRILSTYSFHVESEAVTSTIELPLQNGC